MKNMFSVGELARYQDISRQTLIFYDRIGLFKPALTTDKGYRYYSVEQMDYLDTILILKKIGFSLDEIREHMKNYSTEDSLTFMKGQIGNIEKQIQELSLVKSRLEHKCRQLERTEDAISTEPFLTEQKSTYLLYEKVKSPYGRKEISIATKKCFAESLGSNLPVFFQSGVSVPMEKMKSEKFTEADLAFLISEKIPGKKNVMKIPSGKVASIYHKGNYYEIDSTYRKLLSFCRENNLEIISPSYEFVINDYITSAYEEEFLTKIIVYVK